jgi:hypothetical protein
MTKLTDEELAAQQEFGSYTPEQARSTIAQLKASEEFIQKRFDGFHAGHKLAVASWNELHRRAYPEPSIKR